MFEIAAKRSFQLPEDGVERLAEHERGLLIDLLLQEFSATGLGSDDEPNQRGVGIEEIIDVVGSMADQSRASSD
ncbi:hypothetical protein ACLB90_15560 [Stenotrophomonas sp. LGBM10]|uniref:hypothetical protein n=1 Tax=Stenotrophomonas sp. LGBM10 TaxID=3390038 RepID=UPI00398B788C